MIERTNPSLKANLYARFAGIPLDPAGTMTIEGTIAKTAMMMLLALASGAFNWYYCSHVNPGVGLAASVISMFVGLGVSFWVVFKPDQAAIGAPIYAVVEGVVLGGISALYNARYAGIVQTAIPLTLCIAMGMLLLYRTGVIKASPLFVKTIVLMTLGACLFGFLNFICYMVTGATAFVPGDTLSIAISLFICGIAALNFIIDFEFVAQGPAAGAPKYMEWYGAFALCVTLFWLYFQILRLLRLMRR